MNEVCAESRDRNNIFGTTESINNYNSLEFDVGCVATESCIMAGNMAENQLIALKTRNNTTSWSYMLNSAGLVKIPARFRQTENDASPRYQSLVTIGLQHQFFDSSETGDPYSFFEANARSKKADIYRYRG